MPPVLVIYQTLTPHPLAAQEAANARRPGFPGGGYISARRAVQTREWKLSAGKIDAIV